MTHDPTEELDAVAAALAHDLRAPLRAIDGFSRILLSEERNAELPEDTRRYLALVRDAGTELAELLDDLVDIVRIGRRTPAVEEDVDVGQLSRELIEAVLAPRAQGVAWTIDDALPPCRADPALLRRLLEELLDNAVKFGAGHVEVGWDADASAYVVADDGIGVLGELPAQAYEIFGRLHARDAYPGTGAGLAIACRIAALHGGRLWVAGRDGGGACARFTVGR
ncbi:MAG TPA: ATP-binding protein [Baekduia sp.]|uniref:sensor histidine kinase n=1 Tax=Baekduia sp. TaxID=2600305 RepID=UPI002D7A3249|nr:ATP-binding protein [Baekduia sp.]HET6505839.1 ATP-binding protein [Baekduia sp.]